MSEKHYIIIKTENGGYVPEVNPKTYKTTGRPQQFIVHGELSQLSSGSGSIPITIAPKHEWVEHPIEVIVGGVKYT
jgi:hypothetical protein